jgi:hypothetical protein
MIDQDTHGAPGCAGPSRVKPGSSARLPDGFDPGDRFGLHKQKTGTVVPGTAGRICTYSGSGLIRPPVEPREGGAGLPGSAVPGAREPPAWPG